MIASTLPVTSSQASWSRQVGDMVMKELPRRGGYLAQSVKNSNLPLVSGVGSSLVKYFSNMEFHAFEKVPELGNLTVSKTPTAVLILALFGFTTGGRLDAAVRRAEVKPDGTKDYRELRDIIIRDYSSMVLWLFGFHWLKDKIENIYEAQGNVLPLLPKNKKPRLKIFERPLLTGSQKIIDYQSHLHPYRISSDSSLLHVMEHPFNRNNVEGVIRKELNSYPDLLANPEWSMLGNKFQTAAMNAKSSLDSLDTVLRQGLLDLREATLKLPEALEHVRRSLFNVPGLGLETLENKGIEGLKAPLAEQVNALTQQVAETSEPLLTSHSSESALKSLLHRAKEALTPELLDELKQAAANENGFIDKHLQNELGLKKGGLNGLLSDKAYKKAFTNHWQGLHSLAELLPQWHGHQATTALLEQPETANGVLNHLKEALSHSKAASETLGELEASLGDTVLKKKWFNKIPIPLSRLNPKNLLVKASQTFRAPSDWIALCAILGLLGLFPAWFNKVLTDTLYHLHITKQGSNEKGTATEETKQAAPLKVSSGNPYTLAQQAQVAPVQALQPVVAPQAQAPLARQPLPRFTRPAVTPQAVPHVPLPRFQPEVQTAPPSLLRPLPTFSTVPDSPSRVPASGSTNPYLPSLVLTPKGPAPLNQTLSQTAVQAMPNAFFAQ